MTACGGVKVIKGEAPLISISTLQRTSDSLVTNFDVRNPNGVDMVIERIEIGIEIQGQSLKRADRRFELTIDANGAEEIRVDSEAGKETLALLDQLQDRDILSLPYQLDGRVHTRNEGIETITHKGHLYPVPGRSGVFRAAGANTPREDQRVRYEDQ
jgi:LEA14-like dessication related protein